MLEKQKLIKDNMSNEQIPLSKLKETVANNKANEAGKQAENKAIKKNGKGSTPRNNQSSTFRDNYDAINWTIGNE